MDLTGWVLVVGGGVFAFLAIRIVGEDERFAVIAAGRFKKLVGPGLVLRWPGAPESWVRLKIGQFGTYLGDNLARFSRSAVPVEVSGVALNDSISITSFREGKVWCVQAAERVIVCEKCGHEMRIGA